MQELSKSIFKKLHDSRYATRYLVGDGIDIGAGNDGLSQYMELFPLMRSCRSWDLDDGDAQFMEGIPNQTFDFVHSSHCLEHLVDIEVALFNWIRILRPGGHLICTVPDEDMYEQGIFPSQFNSDHRHTFTIYKKESWSTASKNILDILTSCKGEFEIKLIELLDSTYRYKLNNENPLQIIDQTNTPIGECAIEFILKKRISTL